MSESEAPPILIPVEMGTDVVMVQAVVSGNQSSGPREIASGLPRLSDVVASIRSVVAEMLSSLEGLSLGKVSMQFGITFTVRSGKLVAAFVEAGQDCSFTVTLEWAPRT
jgi:Trypsin-co-occurring domain 1